MRLLGAILAGGASRRFGSDKALAEIDGKPMLAHVAERLSGQCEALVVVGHDWPGLVRVDDRPLPNLGPLGGLAGALAYGAAQGFDAVLTSGCDLPGLPADVGSRLGYPNAIVQGQPTIGLWACELAEPIAKWLVDGGDRSIRAWAAEAGARRVDLGEALDNINTRADLSAFLR